MMTSTSTAIEKTLRAFVAREVAAALAPYLDLLDRTERFFAYLKSGPPERGQVPPRPRRRRASLPTLSSADIQVLKCLDTELEGPDLALASRVGMKILDQTLRALYQKLGVAEAKNPRAAAVRRFRAALRAPLPPQPVPYAVDQVVRVPQLRGSAEATILAIDPRSGDLTVELVEDGRVFQLPSGKAIRQSE